MFIDPKNLSDNELIEVYETQPDNMHIFYGTDAYDRWIENVKKEYERRFYEDGKSFKMA